MRRITNPFRFLALAGILSVVAWGCSTDSPTAPRQEAPPIPPGPGQVYYISVDADPGGIVISETAPTGDESATIVAEVRLDGPNGPRAADGTTILLTTTIGSFSSDGTVREIGGQLVNGRLFATLFAGELPIQQGVATVRGFLAGSHGEVDVPISSLEASFVFAVQEGGSTVAFTDTSKGNPTIFSWDFGDRTSSSSRNPVHRYRSPGTYKVRLTASKRIAGVLLSDVTDQVNVLIAEPTPTLP